MAYKEEDLTIENIDGGNVVKEFNKQLGKVINDLADDEATMASRKVTLTLDLKPSKVGEGVEIKYSVKPTFAPPEGGSVIAMLSKNGDENCIREFIPGEQKEIFEELPSGNVEPFKKRN
jgi:hypothetical protein